MARFNDIKEYSLIDNNVDRAILRVCGTLDGEERKMVHGYKDSMTRKKSVTW